MSTSGHRYPLTYDDIPCESCGRYFTFDGDLIDHRTEFASGPWNCKFEPRNWAESPPIVEGDELG